MFRKNLLHWARALLIVWFYAALARPLSIMAAAPRPTLTPETILEAHQIPITRKGVFGALASHDATVRDAAAQVAINRWPEDARHPVERAMLNESLVWNKTRMASELLGLGDPLGRETLIKLCHDMTVPGSARMAAANDLVGFNDNSCLDSVFNTLQSPTDLHDTVAKEDALELAPELIRHFGPQRYPAVLQLVINSLRDPWPSNRTRASQVLVQIGDPATIPNLEAAIAEEKDATRRSIMTESLRDLKAKNQRR